MCAQEGRGYNPPLLAPPSPPASTWTTQLCRRRRCVCGNAAAIPASSSSVKTRLSSITSSVAKGGVRRSGGAGRPKMASG